MIRFAINLIIAYILLLAIVNAKFPDDPKSCSYGDSDCISKTIEYLLKEKSEGDSSLNLVKTQPLEVNKIHIKQGAESPVNIDLIFSKSKLYGFSDAKVTKVKGFGKDLTQKHEIILKVKTISLVGDYSINGRILVLPISGKGPSNITMTNTDVHLVFNGIPYDKDGATYMKVDKLKLLIEPKTVHFKIDNLFNGDKILGDNMNLFLNENWQDIYREVREAIQNAFGKIFESVIKHVFSKLPYEKYFSQ